MSATHRPDPEPLPRPRGRWVTSYARHLFLTDLVVVTAMVLLAQGIRFESVFDVTIAGMSDLNYWAVSGVLVVLWMLALAVNGGYDRKILGSGPREYHRVVNASLYLFGFIAIVSYLGRLDIARGYLVLALPLGLVGILAGRWVWRLLLREHRRTGTHLHNVLVVGSRRSALDLATRLRSAPDFGYRVSALCLPTTGIGPVGPTGDVGGFPVIGDLGDVLAAIRSSGVDTVAVSSSEQFGSEEVRRLGWQLEGSGIRLCLAPSLTDVAGPRIHIKPVAGLPLMHVEEPRFRGPKLVLKTALDLSVAGVGLLVLSPVMLAVALAIAVKDPGPIFFRQERVGRAGERFRVWKFRSMTVGADRVVDQARSTAGQQHEVFYKSASDARVTPLGAFLRRTSLDELPQLFNVVTGQMSIVGPRPLVPGEGAEIGHFLERRMLVKPGITGLWQVSGRSDVSATERIRLDFYYVENWSVAGDLTIMVKTVKAVVAGRGAY
ncbi:sugar transferase [Nakamurella flavida]|uniref:Sugar transferase n=1 Tax=Nakamurella flavida TaxID=363630 RepID=A0A938YRY2_9ACTN|nr:sugar transferase [Nakamurella flavida]MBM9477790.1 sugar transferase [Nakamurella flavida]MDP9779343.1 exopolysaccharide biosynthesis polyprenyl glycosylphosphotransferase [Nakamurella flavida]